MIAMLLAGGQGSRLGVLTSKVAKPAVSFGGKYRIIDFPLSNCINSGVDTVGVLTQYQPLRLNTHIGIGIPWDLDRNIGGVTVLPPYEKITNSEWYTGTANAIYQNIDYMESYNPEYVLILSGDHIYKMDYEVMLDFHKEKGADVTIDSIAEGKTVNMVPSRRFWSFQAKLLKTSDYTGASTTILLRFKHDGDTLHLYDPVKYKATITDPDGMDTPLTDSTLLLPYGIPSLSSSFRILRLSSEWMILESKEGIRIRFRKF